MMEAYGLIRRGQTQRLPKALLFYAVLPAIPAVLVWLAAGRDLPMWLGIALTLAIVMPISPLLYRIAFRPLADASVLVLLIVAVAVHFAISGLALLYFGPEGFRTEPMSRAFFELGTISVSGQSILIVASSAIFSFLLFLFFERTLTGKALRATAVNRIGARLVGILPSTTGATAFLLASVHGGYLRHPDRAGDDALLQFRLPDRTEGVRRRHHRRPGQLSGDRRRRDAGRTV